MKRNSLKRIVCVCLMIVCILTTVVAFAASCSKCGATMGTLRVPLIERKVTSSTSNGKQTHTIKFYSIIGCRKHNPSKKLDSTKTENCSFGNWKYSKVSNLDIKYCSCSGCTNQIWRQHVHDLKESKEAESGGTRTWYKCVCGYKEKGEWVRLPH